MKILVNSHLIIYMVGLTYIIKRILNHIQQKYLLKLKVKSPFVAPREI